MTRRSFSTKRRAEIFAAASGLCHICGGKIVVGEAWEVEHVLPLALGGTDDDANLRPAHVGCHADKTRKADVPAIARAERLRLKHMGARPKSPMARRYAEQKAWRQQKEAAE